MEVAPVLEEGLPAQEEGLPVEQVPIPRILPVSPGLLHPRLFQLGNPFRIQFNSLICALTR